ncbi:hypothetical protein JKA74_12500 [Marivirga sp. S37H4]|uniref:Bacterial surface antigen (D15) domain-containing protein n=1 Tax=Marivirga aurantiaca TaxID=2802615 RepID=A0A935C8X8_9BACT|nr:hypothetical protein [Marivirga aurantiaca]MBK6265856.1 hypothetical protein [Marivirga aurantiaca]
MYIPAKINTKLSRILWIWGMFCAVYFFSTNVIAQDFDFKRTISESENETGIFKPNNTIDSLQNLGYLAASYYVRDTSSSTFYYFQLGKRFLWGRLTFYQEGQQLDLFTEETLTGKYANKSVLKRKLNKYLRKEAHNKGYPFAEADLQIDSISNYKVYATVNIYLKNRIVYDSIEVKSDKPLINEKYLQNYLKIQVGSLFSTEEYLSIPEKLNQLPFLELTEPPLLQFSNSKSQITLSLLSTSKNQLDAFIGLVPEGEKTNVTGQVDVSFQNLFKRAIIWQLNWQKYSANSQFLNTYLAQKATFKTPLGLEAQFGLLQEDSTFLQNSYRIGLFYPFKNSLTIGMGYKGISNNIIREFDSTEIKQADDPFRSSQINSISFSISWREKPTYPILKNDYYIMTINDLGLKKLKNHSQMPEEWRDVPEKSGNYNGLVEIGAQQKVKKRFLLEERLQLAIVENKVLSRNDLLRLGGLQNLRGFDRNFFYASNYVLLNLNYRYFLDNNSSFFLLTDIARLQNAIGTVYALGAGLDIKSKNGWFRLIYAVGANTDEKINFSTAKVHFGYIALF